jgi:hypothetical protein
MAEQVGMSREEAQAYIAALLRERRSCEVRGLTDRVKLINKELARLGYEAEIPAKRSERRPASATASKRG